MKAILAQAERIFDDVAIPENELGNDQLASVLSFVFVLVGIISVIMIMIAGLQYITSTGDPQKTKKAKDTIIYALIGLVISVSAWVIVGFVLGGL